MDRAAGPNQRRQPNLLNSFNPPLPLEGSDWSFPLGTDEQGRDVLSAIMFGSRISLIVGAASVIFAVVVGVAVGLLAGYAGGMVDAFLMRAADVQLTFPSILMALLVDGVVSAELPRNLHATFQIYVLIFAIGISPLAAIRPHRAGLDVGGTQQGLCHGRAADRAGPGAHHGDAYPAQRLGPVLVLGTLTLGLAILDEATLSFLGVGLPPTQPSLGTLIRIGDDFLFSGQWWVTIFPGVALVLMVLSINLLGDWLRDALNPRLR